MLERIHKRIQGRKIVTCSIRPPRVAYIVSSIEQCRAFIRTCSLTWGGKHFCVIPYRFSFGITDEWWHLLEKYDPDEAITCVELDTATRERLIDMILPQPVEEEKQKGWFAPRELVPDGGTVRGQSIYSALIGIGVHEKRERLSPALIPEVSLDHPWRPYVEARYGALDERWASSILIKGHLRGELKLADLIPVKPIRLTGDDLETFLIQDMGQQYGYRDKASSLLDYTLMGLTQQGQERNFVKEPWDESIGYDVHHLLFVSDDMSVEDFCWFWNLRSQRYFHNAQSALWLPAELVERRMDDIARMFPKNVRAFILSKTVPDEKLRRLAERLGSRIEVATENLGRFYAPQFFLGTKREPQEVLFENGGARVLVPQVDVVKLCSCPQYHYVDIELPKYSLPRLRIHSWGKWIFPRYRVSRTGLSFDRWVGGFQDKYIELAVPSPWEMLETFVSIAGYTVELSDKGKLAEEVIQLFGGVENLWVFSGKTVYGLFNQLTELWQAREFKQRLHRMHPDIALEEVMDKIALDHHERVRQTFSNIKDTLGFGRRTAESFVKWLLKQRLIFRGKEIKCPLCMTKQWLFVDELGPTMQCRGCQQMVDTPLKITSTTWQYCVNTLFARAFDQGVVPHLLTLNYYLVGAGASFGATSQITGSSFGMDLWRDKNANNRAMEIDVAWIEDGELVIGECKTHGKELSAKEVNNYLCVAERMRCKRVVFSALDDFADLDPIRFS